jgi:hypothetical protein
MSGSGEVRGDAVGDQASIGRVTLLCGVCRSASVIDLGSFRSGDEDNPLDAVSPMFSRVTHRPPMRMSGECPEWIAARSSPLFWCSADPARRSSPTSQNDDEEVVAHQRLSTRAGDGEEAAP